MADFDMISHLTDVESKASDMLLNAQSEAGERIAKAREQGEARYQEYSNRLSESFKERLTTEEVAEKKAHGDALESYRTSVTSSKTDDDSFTALLNKRLFG